MTQTIDGEREPGAPTDDEQREEREVVAGMGDEREMDDGR